MVAAGGILPVLLLPLLEQRVLQTLEVTEHISTSASGPPPSNTHSFVHGVDTGVEIMGETFMRLHNDNMNFQLKHLMREQHNLGMCVGAPQAGPLSSASPWNTLFTKHPPELELQEKRFQGFTCGRLCPPPYRVCPLQLQGEGGRVRKVPSFHTPPGRWHRLGVRGHGGAAASSINRKWVWLQSRRCTLLVILLSQQPGKRRKERQQLES